MRYCAVCCMAKDEDPFIREWVAYHLLLGFDHCIVVDDASARPVAGLLDGWATPDLVTVVRHETPQGQNATYERCLERFGGDFFWMAFLDVDEFIRCANPWPGMGDAQWAGQADIRAVLGAYEPYGAVGVNWRMFSWSGHDRRPAGLVMDNYMQCLGDDTHVKSVVRPAAVRSCATPHSFCLRPGWSAVDAGRFPLPDGFPFAVPQTRLLAVNHYYFKSREDFRQKVARGNPVRIPRHMEEFEGHVSRPATEDAGLRPFVAPVRDLLGRPELRLDRPATGLVEPGACRDALRAVAEDICRGGAGLGAAELRGMHVRLADIRMANEARDSPETAVTLEIWLHRARLALLVDALDLAEHCLRRALHLGAASEAYVLLAELALKRQDLNASKAALAIARHKGEAGRARPA